MFSFGGGKNGLERAPFDHHTSHLSSKTEAKARHSFTMLFYDKDKVEKIEERAFKNCPRLRRVIMRRVKIVEGSAFYKIL